MSSADPYAALGVPIEESQNTAQPDAVAPAAAAASAPADPYAQVSAPADASAQIHHYRVKTPDGRTYDFPAPADATPEELDALSRKAAGYGDKYPVTAAEPGVGKQLLDNTVNDVAGMAQGAAALPDMAAEGVGKVLSAIPNLISQGLDAAGHSEAAKWVQDNVTHQLANPAQIGDLIEGASPTPDTDSGKTDRFISQLAGGAAAFPSSAAESLVGKIVGEVPKAVETVSTAAPGLVREAKDAGIRVLTSDVKPPRTFVGKSAQAIGERIPISGTGGVREAQQAERIAAVKSVAQDYGATADELAPPVIDGVAKDLADTRGALVKKLTAQKNAVIDKLQGAVPAPKATTAINEQIARLTGINSDAYAPVIAKLQNFRDQIASGKTLSQIEGNRKLLGDMFSDPSLASIRGDGEKAVNAIYAPLREDMGAFIKTNGDPADFSRWKGANDQLAGLAGKLKNTALKRALATSEITPENVARLLFSTKPSDVRLLYDSLSPTGQTKAQSAIIQRAVEKAGGVDNISPDRFATQIKNLGGQIGVFFSGKDLARVSGLGRVLSATQRASQAAIGPPTGVQAVPYAMGAGFTSLFGLPGGISAAAGTGLLARAYESAPVRDLLLKLGRTKPGGPQEKMLLKRAVTAVNAALQKHVPEALNDNTLSSAVAEPQEQDQQ